MALWNRLNEYVGQSRIPDMSDSIAKITSTYNIIAESEREYERQRKNNSTKAVKNAIESIYGRGLNLISDQSFESITNKDYPNVSTADLLPPRAVGPLEEMPIGTLFQDSIMLENVVKQTQVKAEHKLQANLAMNRSVRRTLPNGELKIIKNKLNVGPMVFDYFDPDVDFTFKIKNMALENSKYGHTKWFPAYIQNYNENIGASWDAIHFINATEDKYIYQKGDRSFTLEFILFVGAKDYIDLNGVELKIEKERIAGIPELKTYQIITSPEFIDHLEFLQKLTRPSLDNGVISEVPFCELTIGNLIVKQKCIFDSVAFNFDPLLWDLNIDSPNYLRPNMVVLSLTGKYLHDNPSVDTQFYGERL